MLNKKRLSWREIIINKRLQIIALMAIILTALFAGGVLANKGNINKTIENIPFINSLIKNIPTPSPELIECYIKGKKIFTTRKNCKELSESAKQIESTPKPIFNTKQESDPIIDCKFTYIGTKKLRRSVCARSTDCEINGKWYYYDSVDKCKQDQATSNQEQNTKTNNSSKVPVYIKTYNITYNCKPEGVDAVKSADKTMAQKNNDFKNCLSDSGKNLKECLGKCTDSSTFDICSSSCDSAYGTSTCKAPDDYSGLENLLNQYCK